MLEYYSKIDVGLEEETVWLSQAQMSELFQKERSVITEHIKKVFEEGELQEESNVQILHSRKTCPQTQNAKRAFKPVPLQHPN